MRTAFLYLKFEFSSIHSTLCKYKWGENKAIVSIFFSSKNKEDICYYNDNVSRHIWLIQKEILVYITHVIFSAEIWLSISKVTLVSLFICFWLSHPSGFFYWLMWQYYLVTLHTNKHGEKKHTNINKIMYTGFINTTVNLIIANTSHTL